MNQLDEDEVFLRVLGLAAAALINMQSTTSASQVLREAEKYKEWLQTGERGPVR